MAFLAISDRRKTTGVRRVTVVGTHGPLSSLMGIYLQRHGSAANRGSEAVVRGNGPTYFKRGKNGGYETTTIHK